MNVQVEFVTVETAAAAVALLDAQLREHEIATPAALLHAVVERVCSDPREGFMLLARDDAEPIGIAFAAAHASAEHGGTVGWLEELYVTPGYRGSGVGSALLSRVISHAQELPWRALELEVVAGHERVMPLYERHGFSNANRARFTRLLLVADQS
jgi:GNAT superfamily N-acetyltransferase